MTVPDPFPPRSIPVPAEVTVTIPLDSDSARLNAAIACGYPDWQALLDDAPELPPAASAEPVAP